MAGSRAVRDAQGHVIARQWRDLLTAKRNPDAAFVGAVAGQGDR
jgi:hypothetical protein